MTHKARSLALSLLGEALVAVRPQRLVNRVLQLERDHLLFFDQRFRLKDFPGIFVIGAGKATGRMAEAVEGILKDSITDGFIIVPHGTEEAFALDRIQVASGGHPLPTTASIVATQNLLDLVQQAPTKALIICLISGGGSALLEIPTHPITIEDLQTTYSLLIHSGAPIDAINTIRKHLSQIKGGHLARHIHPRPLWTLLISDVPGDQMDVIASGPTLPDPTTFSMTKKILTKFKLWDQLPTRVRQHIKAGISSNLLDTPKPGDAIFSGVHNRLVGSNRDACEAALMAAQDRQIMAHILTTDCQGEAREVGVELGRRALQLYKEAIHKAHVLIIGSETTVTVRYQGKGGRNSELVTAAMPLLQDYEGLVIASLATDGIDGPTEFAGAIADGSSYHRALQLQRSPEDALARNNTYDLLQALDDHIHTGPTHTNVRDITIIVAVNPRASHKTEP